MDHPETIPQGNNHLAFDKGVKNIHWNKASTDDAEETGYPPIEE